MLVLTRKQGQSIRIGDDIVISVVRTKGKAVRIGIQAPLAVPVLRGEVAESIRSEEAARAAGEGEEDPFESETATKGSQQSASSCFSEKDSPLRSGGDAPRNCCSGGNEAIRKYLRSRISSRPATVEC
jgi:carbon storage regulator